MRGCTYPMGVIRSEGRFGSRLCENSAHPIFVRSGCKRTEIRMSRLGHEPPSSQLGKRTFGRPEGDRQRTVAP